MRTTFANVAGSAALLASQVAGHAESIEADLKCQYPEDIPNGVRMIRAGLTDSVDHTPRRYQDVLDEGMHIGHYMYYQCNPGSELRFNHNNQPARVDQCYRQCHMPSEHECGGVEAEENYEYLHRPVLDASNCHCHEPKCPRILDSDLHGTHVLVDEHDRNRDHWPVEGFNSVKVQCKQHTFPENHGVGVGRIETIYCNEDGWSTPDSCLTTGCPNPRINAGNFFAPSLNIEHTWSHLDDIDLNANEDEHTWVNIEQNGNLVIYAGRHEHSSIMPFSFPRDGSDRVFLIENNDGTVSNVRDGAVARFHCKHGYHPYYNADIVKQYGIDATMGPRDGNSFECSCEMGKWVCTKHCRCEGFCPDLL